MLISIKRKSDGPLVRKLQSLLNETVRPRPPLPVNGVYDAKSKGVVEQFQRREGLKVDGIVGRRTWAALRRRIQSIGARKAVPVGTGLPITLGMTEEERFDFYLKYLDIATGDVSLARRDLEAGQRIILGLRVPTNTRVRKGKGVYDDRIVVMWVEADDERVREFEANTDPSARYEDGYEHGKKAYGNDANADGVKDLGRIPYGVYAYAKKHSDSYGNILRPKYKIIAERDTNHDGFFDSRDTVTREKALSAGRSFLFHRGGKTITGSAGCQTLKPAVYRQFWESLGSQEDFHYVLVPAWSGWARSGRGDWIVPRTDVALA